MHLEEKSLLHGGLELTISRSLVRYFVCYRLPGTHFILSCTGCERTDETTWCCKFVLIWHCLATTVTCTVCFTAYACITSIWPDPFPLECFHLARKTGFTGLTCHPGLPSVHLQGIGSRLTAWTNTSQECLCFHVNRRIGEATMDIILGNVAPAPIVEIQVYPLLCTTLLAQLDTPTHPHMQAYMYIFALCPPVW